MSQKQTSALTVDCVRRILGAWERIGIGRRLISLVKEQPLRRNGVQSTRASCYCE
jgi:hypothetical protein